LATQEAIHPGVGPMYLEDPIQHHAYYQWVPFVLFLQAIMFYCTHMLWRSWEGGKIKALVEGLHIVELAKFNRKDSNMDVGNMQILSTSAVDGRVTQLRLAVAQHLDVNRYWALWLILCEILNLLNVIFQVYLTDRFLKGQFLELGIDVVSEAFDQSQMTTLDLVFPKMTKCFFHKYGASGSIQQHDTMCVMALNIINEKIFIFLWFWYIILFFVSLVPLLWRLVSMICHSRYLNS
jgi:innexin